MSGLPSADIDELEAAAMERLIALGGTPLTVLQREIDRLENVRYEASALGIDALELMEAVK